MRQIQNQGGTTNDENSKPGRTTKEENSKPRTDHKGGKFKTKDGPQRRKILNQVRTTKEDDI